MSFTIGIGALIDGARFNKIRELEISAASAAANFSGLDQPPHITVKRPFTVDSLEDVQKVQAILADIAVKTAPFDVQYTGVGNFEDKTLFLVVKPSQALQELHAKLLSELHGLFDAQAPFEGKGMVFHTSIATNLQPGQLSHARESVERGAQNLNQLSIRKLGLFLGLDNGSRWIVLFERPLG